MLAATACAYPPGFQAQLMAPRPRVAAPGSPCLPAHSFLAPPCLPQYVLPTEAPNLADQGTRLRTVMTPLLWKQHSPDCFDTYSAGIVLMQLG